MKMMAYFSGEMGIYEKPLRERIKVMWWCGDVKIQTQCDVLQGSQGKYGVYNAQTGIGQALTVIGPKLRDGRCGMP